MRCAYLVVLLALCSCRGPARPTGPTTGTLAGLVRDASSGVGLPGARIVLRRPGSVAPVQSESDESGAYFVTELPPGTYGVSAFNAERPIGEREVEIAAGEVTGLDFAVGALGPAIELNAPSAAPLWRYRPPGASAETAVVEGTVADLRRLQRLAGAVVSVVNDHDGATQVVVTDDFGRYQVRGLGPGTYTISVFYSALRLGQIEVLRNNVQVSGGEVVVVPLWLETELPPGA